jgi:hypothetical protein
MRGFASRGLEFNRSVLKIARPFAVGVRELLSLEDLRGKPVLLSNEVGTSDSALRLLEAKVTNCI